MAASSAASSSIPLPAGSAVPSQHISHCSIPSCITKYEDEMYKRRKYTAFVVEIRTYGGLTWTVDRRYRQFYNLNKVRFTAACRPWPVPPAHTPL
jgi:hypothetical protein